MAKRLFIAIQLSDELRDIFSRYKEKYPELDARWTAPEKLHITAYFCGDVDETNIPEVQEKLNQLRIKPLELSFKEILFAPPHRPPRMIWAQFENNPEFTELTRKIYETIKEFLDPKESRPPNHNPIPHVTLARFKNPEITEGIQLEQPTVDVLKVKSYDLMESKLSPEGSKYIVLQSYALT